MDSLPTFTAHLREYLFPQKGDYTPNCGNDYLCEILNAEHVTYKDPSSESPWELLESDDGFYPNGHHPLDADNVQWLTDHAVSFVTDFLNTKIFNYVGVKYDEAVENFQKRLIKRIESGINNCPQLVEKAKEKIDEAFSNYRAQKKVIDKFRDPQEAKAFSKRIQQHKSNFFVESLQQFKRRICQHVQACTPSPILDEVILLECEDIADYLRPQDHPWFDTNNFPANDSIAWAISDFYKLYESLSKAFPSDAGQQETEMEPKEVWRQAVLLIETGKYVTQKMIDELHLGEMNSATLWRREPSCGGFHYIHFISRAYALIEHIIAGQGKSANRRVFKQYLELGSALSQYDCYGKKGHVSVASWEAMLELCKRLRDEFRSILKQYLPQQLYNSFVKEETVASNSWVSATRRWQEESERHWSVMEKSLPQETMSYLRQSMADGSCLMRRIPDGFSEQRSG